MRGNMLLAMLVGATAIISINHISAQEQAPARQQAVQAARYGTALGFPRDGGKLYLPSHHDASFGSWIDLGIEPLLEKIRDEMPDTRFVAPLYRSPICVATSGPQRGTVTKFRY